MLFTLWSHLTQSDKPTDRFPGWNIPETFEHNIRFGDADIDIDNNMSLCWRF